MRMIRVLVHYIFETTNLLLRAQSRTAKLKSYGNNASYDSVSNGAGKLYSLYIIKRTKISDTLAVKDSLAKFLQKDIRLKYRQINNFSLSVSIKKPLHFEAALYYKN